MLISDKTLPKWLALAEDKSLPAGLRWNTLCFYSFHSRRRTVKPPQRQDRQVLRIFDYIRTFTWKKKLEITYFMFRLVKSVKSSGGQDTNSYQARWYPVFLFTEEEMRRGGEKMEARVLMTWL